MIARAPAAADHLHPEDGRRHGCARLRGRACEYAFEPVPTDVERDRRGNLWVSLLPGGPESPSLGARGAVYKITPERRVVRLVKGGFLGATNLAVSQRQGLRRRAVRRPDLDDPQRQDRDRSARSAARWRSRRPGQAVRRTARAARPSRVRPVRVASTASRADADTTGRAGDAESSGLGRRRRGRRPRSGRQLVLDVRRPRHRQPDQQLRDRQHQQGEQRHRPAARERRAAPRCRTDRSPRSGSPSTA